MRSVLVILIGAFLSVSMACDSGSGDVIDMVDGLAGREVDLEPNRDENLDKITLPPGFRIDLYANDVPNARSLARSDTGVLFVGTRTGIVYAVVDSDDDFVADTTIVVAKNLRSPNGVAFRNGALYVAEVSRILRYERIETSLSQPPTPVVVFDGLPTDGLHGWKFIAFGPDDKLYVPIGAPCNICDRGRPYAALWRMNADGTDFELYASGIRNTVGFGWHPVSEELWFTDNQRDYLGDDIPNDELNYAPVSGLHFGYPYFHAGDVPDPEFGQGRNESDYRAPAARLGPHVAPLGLEFYEGDMFPPEYRHQIFIAEHGSWNRSEKIGYRITLVRLNGSSEVLSYETFAEGWLEGQSNWGRPVDLEHLPDGSLLVSDDQKGVIYRISYSGS